MKHSHHSIQRILDMAERCATHGAKYRVIEVRVFDKYVEPGYTTPESGLICIGNWNSISHYDEATGKFVDDDRTMPRLAKILEKLGAELEWSDEWTECMSCNGLIRTSPDSYGWTRSYYEFDGEPCCQECILGSESLTLEYLEQLHSDPRKAVTLDIDLEKFGYRKLNEESYENGLYGGQADDPKKIAASLQAQGITTFVFKIDGVGQFDTAFSCWVHKSQIKKAKKATVHAKADVDPATAMQNALADASKKMGALKGDGIRYAKCKGDGTADVRLVSPEEFVRGIK